MNGLERPLDTIEAIFAAGARLRTCAAAVLVGVSGPITAESCARALATMPERHPRLRTRVVRDGASFAFTSRGVEPPTLRVVDPVSPAEWARLLEDELARDIDDAIPSLVGATLAPPRDPDGPHAFVLWGQHAALDFRSMLSIALDTLASCAGAPAAEVAGLAAPLDERLPPPGGPRAARAADPAAVVLPFAGRAPMLERRQRFTLHVVPARTCTALVERARRAGATLTGIVTAAALEATRLTWGPLPAIRVGTSVSARPLCTPAIAPDAIGCFVSQLETVHPLSSEVPLWECARAHVADVRERIASGEWHERIRGASGRVAAFEEQLVAMAHDDATQGRMTAIDIVSYGVLDVPSVPPLRLGPIYGGVTNQGVGNCLWLAFGSVDGELQLSLGHVSPLVDDADARRFLDAFDRLLDRAVA